MEIDLSLISESQWNGEASGMEEVEEAISNPISDSGQTISEVSEASSEKEEEVVETITEDEEFDDETPISPREKILLERLEKLTGENFDKSSPVKEESAPLTIQERNFLENITDLDEVFSSPENFNKLLLAVYKMAIEDASKLSAESIMRNLPATISHYTNQHVEMKETIKEFYTENKDLVPLKKTVAAVANEIAAEHPEYTTEKLLQESAIKTRQMLKIKSNVSNGVNKTAPNKTTKNPGFATQRSSNGRVKGEQLTGLTAEIADLLA